MNILENMRNPQIKPARAKTSTERKLLYVLVVLALANFYNAGEAHDHAHLAVNACSDRPVFAEDGRRFEPTP